MILCPNHHSEVGAGAMPEQDQRRYKQSPHNIERGYAEGLLTLLQPYPAISTGRFTLVGQGPLIQIDDEVLVQVEVENERLVLSAELYDSQNRHLVSIRRNEWISKNELPWDLEAKNRWIIIRSQTRNISLQIDARQFPVIFRAKLWYNGALIILNEKGLQYNHRSVRAQFDNYCFVESTLKIDSDSGELTIEQRRGSVMIPEQGQHSGSSGLKKALKVYEMAQRLRAGERIPNYLNAIKKILLDENGGS